MTDFTKGKTSRTPARYDLILRKPDKSTLVIVLKNKQRSTKDEVVPADIEIMIPLDPIQQAWDYIKGRLRF